MANPRVCPICKQELQATLKTFYILTENGWEQDDGLGCSIDVYCENDHNLITDCESWPDDAQLDEYIEFSKDEEAIKRRRGEARAEADQAEEGGAE